MITQTLKDRINRDGLSIADFYSRRIRRILPALIFVLVVSLVAGFFLLLPGDYASLSDSAVYSAFGLGNFYFYWHTGYFDQEASLQPLLHLWSLGVEEQFYLFWPLLLAFGIWATKKWQFSLVLGIATVIVFSLGLAVFMVGRDPKYAFYLPQTRAWELAAGALLVFLPVVHSGRLSLALRGVGVVLIAYSLLTLTESMPFPGLNAVPAVLGSALLIWPAKSTVVSRTLSAAPLRGTGLISYSLYLWHWPLLVFFRHYNGGDMPTLTEAIALVGLCYAISAASWRFIERPAQRAQIARWFVNTAGIVAMSAAAMLALFIHSTGGFVSRVPPELAALSSLEVMWDWKCPHQADIPELGGTFCTFGANWASAKHKGILWSDSHAEHMAPIIEAEVAGKSIAFLLFRECPAILGQKVRRVWNLEPNYVEQCRASRSKATAWLQRNPDVDFVSISSAWSGLANVVSQDGSLPDNLDGAGSDHRCARRAVERNFATRQNHICHRRRAVYPQRSRAVCYR